MESKSYSGDPFVLDFDSSRFSLGSDELLDFWFTRVSLTSCSPSSTRLPFGASDCLLIDPLITYLRRICPAVAV
jgi:hypothetical protein